MDRAAGTVARERSNFGIQHTKLPKKNGIFGVRFAYSGFLLTWACAPIYQFDPLQVM
jgi:hypothetical protein